MFATVESTTVNHCASFKFERSKVRDEGHWTSKTFRKWSFITKHG